MKRITALSLVLLLSVSYSYSMETGELSGAETDKAYGPAAAQADPVGTAALEACKANPLPKKQLANLADVKAKPAITRKKRTDTKAVNWTKETTEQNTTWKAEKTEAISPALDAQKTALLTSVYLENAATEALRRKAELSVQQAKIQLQKQKVEQTAVATIADLQRRKVALEAAIEGEKNLITQRTAEQQRMALEIKDSQTRIETETKILEKKNVKLAQLTATEPVPVVAKSNGWFGGLFSSKK